MDTSVPQISPPKLQPFIRKQYSWEKKQLTLIPTVTKEFFRCKGQLHRSNRIYHEKRKRIELKSCEGAERHTLPHRNNKEFVYPVLIDLLNHVQKELKRRVCITTGHRCPIHNRYADHSKNAKKSKHLIGAEVDFYVLGLENNPHEAIKAIMHYYQGSKGSSEFQLNHSNPRQLKHPGWHNHEVAILISEKDEGRDADNEHPYPYITIEVLRDRDTNRPVHYNWHQAVNGYLKK